MRPSRLCDVRCVVRGAAVWLSLCGSSAGIVLADYVERFETFSVGSNGTWLTVDLSGAPYNVPANAVVEVAVLNTSSGSKRYGGVRAVGSSLERRERLHKGGGGSDVMVMHAATNGSSELQAYAENTSDVQFRLLGYWTSGTYVEAFDTFTAGAGGSWQDHNLSTYGVGAGQVAEILVANSDVAAAWQGGVRANGSSLARIVDLNQASGGGGDDIVDTVTMFVNADGTASATIEVYAESDADIEFFLLGYWSSAPATYVEKYADLGSPSGSAAWEDKDLSAHGLTNFTVAEIGLGSQDYGTAHQIGVREDASTSDRYLGLEAGGSAGGDYARMHVSTGGALAEWYHSSIAAAHEIVLLGYWRTDLAVGPSGSGACKGSDCDYSTVQSAIDAALPGDTITLHFNDDTEYSPVHTDNNCYNEHLTINVPNLTIQGDSTTPISAACLGPSTGGDIVTITASGVALKNLHISGKANDGSDGLNSKGAGGRSSGYGIHIVGDDVDDVVIDNVTVSFSRLDNIRWDGDQNNGNDGNVTIRNCYLHHSDLPDYNIRIIGGSSATESHLVENNLITTGRGILSDAEYITVQKNIINGWPYWGHLAASGSYPETHDYGGQSANFGGGWRYFSRCSAGVHIQNGGAGTDIQILHNLIVGTHVGIRVQTSGTISQNTVVNPFNANNSYTDAATVRNSTVGIMLVSGFSGTVQNNNLAVTEDNRATGQPAQNSAPTYTTGITGYGVGFSGGSGTLAGGALIQNNNVWGFVDTDGSTATNWGSGLESCADNSAAQCSNNISRDPQFADDTSDESNGGSGPCDADAANSRCYELYHDNFFLKTDRASGGCHADVRLNTAGYVGYVDLTSTYDLAGLDDCQFAADAGTPSSLIDFGSGAVSGEPGTAGGFANLGAFGNTARASQSPTLRIVGIDVGDGGVKSDNNDHSGPGIVQARNDGVTTVNLYFNRAPNLNGLSSFAFRNFCDSADLTAPTLDTTAASTPPFRVTLTWPAGTYANQGVRVHVLADDPVNKIVDYLGEALDGDITHVTSGTVPSGDGTAGGDAQFAVYSLIGDVDGDLDVDTTDRSAVAALDGSTTAGLPEDLDGDGTVEGGGADDDYLLVDGAKAEYWVNSNSDSLAAGTLRKALTDVADNETIRFKIGTFDSCQNATIDVNSSALPAITGMGITVDASDGVVILEDTNSDLADGDDGLVLSGNNNILYGLQIQNFDAGASSYGIYVNGSGNVLGGTGSGQGNTITGNGAAGVFITGATADGNTLRRNLIHNNTGIAIDLAGDGANDDVAAAVITRATPLEVQGTASANATVDVFKNDDNNSNCETFLGSATAGGSGDWTLGSLSLTVGDYIVAAQSEADGDSAEVSAPHSVGYLVNTTADENDGSCTDGDCSLRDALTLVANGQFIVFDTAVFPPATPATIDVDGSALPALDNDDVTIDASNAGVIIDDPDGDLSGGDHGLTLSGDNNTVMGLQIKNFDADSSTHGVFITGANNTVGGVYNGAAANELGQGCLISSNANGITISGAGATGNAIQGCLIGTARDGVTADGNSKMGVYVISSANANTIGGDRDDGRGNVIASSGQVGIHILGAGGENNVIKGNTIGTDAADSVDLGHAGNGILVDTGQSNVIGSTVSGEENIIAYNGAPGIELKNGTADFNSIRANIIHDHAESIKLGGGANDDLSPPSVDTVSTTQVDGSGAAANATVDVFTNTAGDEDCLVYIGSATADGSGDWTLGSLSLTAGHYVVAIQTDTSGNSSQVSGDVVVP